MYLGNLLMMIIIIFILLQLKVFAAIPTNQQIHLGQPSVEIVPQNDLVSIWNGKEREKYRLVNLQVFCDDWPWEVSRKQRRRKRNETWCSEPRRHFLFSRISYCCWSKISAPMERRYIFFSRSSWLRSSNRGFYDTKIGRKKTPNSCVKWFA